MLSVNETLEETAPRKSLKYIGIVLPRIIYAVAIAETNIPCLFTKVDIKDGFWHIFVEEAGCWNFACVLLKNNVTDNIHIIVPNSIQMGWAESMCIFCASSETARDTANLLLKNKITLSPYPLEKYMIPEHLCVKNQSTDKSPQQML